jgi:AcrR family transcriptional regulator
MNTSTRRRYSSPLRQARALETRERILAAVAAHMRRDQHADFTLDTIARDAGVERRTLFRHFATREALLEAFWVWINERVTARTLPASLDELLAAPRETFARFDDEDLVIRASLHTQAGRAMRMAAIPARRQAFRDALHDATRGASAADRRRLEAAAHALYSASAWEAMRDYAGITGAEAGDAAAWALAILVDAVRGGAPRRRAGEYPKATRTPRRRS